MEYHMYLLEILLKAIEFDMQVVKTCPSLKDLEFLINMGNLLEVEIGSDAFIIGGMNSKNSHKMKMNVGRSVLFSCKADDILKEMKMGSLAISVVGADNFLAVTEAYWDMDFLFMVEKSKDKVAMKSLKPSAMETKCVLKSINTQDILGSLKIGVRLTCFGPTVETNYQILDSEGGDKRFVIKNTGGTATFECQKRPEGSFSEMIPIGPLYDTKQMMPRVSMDTTATKKSWTSLFAGMNPSVMSAAPPEFNSLLHGRGLTTNYLDGSRTTFDVMSIMERPEEGKFIDLRLRPGSGGFKFEYARVDNLRKSNQSILNPMHEEAELRTLFREGEQDGITINTEMFPRTIAEHRNVPKESEDVKEQEEPEDLSAGTINRLLCQNKDCPAAKKFKKYGIGPLANVKGLGTIYDDPVPPVTYGMSNTYGVMDDYGPFGLFSRPKRPDQPFIPKADTSDFSKSCWRPKRNKRKISSSSAGSTTTASTSNKQRCGCQSTSSPLRLKGGGLFDYDDIKSPFHECKDLMDQMDECLMKYKSALGPCGKTTCPYAPNVIQDSCKKACEMENGYYEEDTERVSLVPPMTPPPSLATVLKPKLPVGACGSEKCAYAKHKMGLHEVDEELELQYLPPAGSGRCGHPNCPYPIEPDLPPIHWDCPDPLPKGPCKNPRCPYLPRDLVCMNEKAAEKNLCGYPTCPYSLPPSCGSPVCPFNLQAPQTCPYQQQQIPDVCANPTCPYAAPPQDNNNPCDNPQCPYVMQAMTGAGGDICGNPQCPYAPLPPQQCGGVPEEPSSCSNPGCPYATPKSPPKGCGNTTPRPPVCDNPTCPYASPPQPSGGCGVPKQPSTCSNPACPYAAPKPPPTGCGNTIPKPPVCDNPTCPYAIPPQPQTGCGVPKQPSTCSNPTCPYAAPKSPPTGCGSTIPKPPVCDNPTCPYSSPPQPAGGCGVPKQPSTCSNPTCPYASPKSPPTGCGNTIPKPPVCDNPTCPYAIPPQPQLGCGVPKQPSTCSNPACPYATPKSPPQGCGGTPKPPVCDNPTSPYAPPKPIQVCGMPCPPPTCPLLPCQPQNPPCGPMPAVCPPVCDNPCMQQMIQAIVQAVLAGEMSQAPCGMGAQEFEICLSPPCYKNAQYGGDARDGDESTCYRPSVAEDTSCSQPCKPSSPEDLGGGTPVCNAELCGNGVKDEGVAKKKVCTCSRTFGPRDEETSEGGRRLSRQYRPSQDVDAKPDEGQVEYSSDTRISIDTRPCRQGTCKEEGGSLVCEDCGEDGIKSRRISRQFRPSQDVDTNPDEGVVEITSDTRTDVDLVPCKPKTCKGLGGGPLVCDRCPCGKSKSETKPSDKKGKTGKKERKSKSAPTLGGGITKLGMKKIKGKYVYKIGDKYPGVKIGHRYCCTPGFKIPAKMGWLWNIHVPCLQLKPRRGWRPGAVGRTIAQCIMKHREAQGLTMRETPKFKGKRRYGGEYVESDTSINVKPKPTLQIKKKDGCYWITMNPLKDPYTLAENEDPYMECTPMQFKIVKNKDNKQINVKEGDGDYKTCYCGEDGEAGDNPMGEWSSSSDSELDIEFTPPAGIIHPERFKKKKNVVHCDTQYNSQDFEDEKKPEKKGKKGKKGKKDKKGKKKGGKKGKKKK